MSETIADVTVTETDLDSHVETPAEAVATPVEAPTEVAPSQSPSLKEREAKFNADIEAKTIVETLAESMDTFNVEKLMEVLPELMRHVQVYKNLNGEQKKKLVIKMINHLVDITDSPGDDEIWDPILKRMVPGIIDTLVKVDKKKLVLRKKNKILSKFLICL